MDFKICKKCNKKLKIEQFQRCSNQFTSSKKRRNTCKKCCAHPKIWGISYKKDLQRVKNRFEEKVIKGDGCWSFIGYKNSNGCHTMYSFYRKRDYAHRVSWIIHKGPIPDKMLVRHTCSNNGCCNPDHLYLMSKNKFSVNRFWRDATPAQKLERNKEIFYARVIKGKSEKDCWHFTGYKNKNGYYNILFNNETNNAHRVSYLLHNGPIPKGMLVCHTCDERYCVSPSHLFLGTYADNARDMVEKGRSLKGSKNHNSSINEEDAFQIKKFLRMGLSPLEIEIMIGVSKRIIRQIRDGKTWKHIKI